MFMNRQNSSMLRNNKSLVLALGLFRAVFLPGRARAATALTFAVDNLLPPSHQ